MSSAALLLLVALGQVPRPEPTPDPAALVRELGAPRYAERQAAALELERMGSPALPALRTGRQSRDMEIRTRAQGLLLKIETALLTQPTFVRLDFDGAPLSEVAQSLSRQTGFKIALYPQNLPRWKKQRVTFATLKFSASGRPWMSFATPRRSSITRACRGSLVSKIRFSRSPRA